MQFSASFFSSVLQGSVMPDAIRHPGIYWIPAFAGMTPDSAALLEKLRS